MLTSSLQKRSFCDFLWRFSEMCLGIILLILVDLLQLFPSSTFWNPHRKEKCKICRYAKNAQDIPAFMSEFNPIRAKSVCFSPTHKIHWLIQSLHLRLIRHSWQKQIKIFFDLRQTDFGYHHQKSLALGKFNFFWSFLVTFHNYWKGKVLTSEIGNYKVSTPQHIKVLADDLKIAQSFICSVNRKKLLKKVKGDEIGLIGGRTGFCKSEMFCREICIFH